jgi:hypothetical protein
MASTTQPTKDELGRIAERQPELLNVLVAYFVMEWRTVEMGAIPSGTDQTGTRRVVPNYTRMLGIDECMHYLLQAPRLRGSDGPGLLTDWLERTT